MSLNFDKWWDNHGKHNLAEFDWNASDRRRIRELMKLAFEVGAEGKAKKESLIDGKIPANTVCPFRDRCEIAQAGTCKHMGADHSVPFSCAAARMFEMFN